MAEISINWPLIFNITAFNQGDTSLRDDNTIQYPLHLTIADNHDEAGTVTYQLIGRQLFINGNHFVSQIRIGKNTFTYDDMDGTLISSGDSKLLEVPDKRTACYVYHRTSKKSSVSTSHRLYSILLANSLKRLPNQS